MFHLLIGTLLLRPYVFLFLFVYLILSGLAWGWQRSLLYLITGYVLAWLAEYSSIHTGFPFGLYAYISQPTIDKELWVKGVPFMDSLSFVFLTFAGLQTARLVVEPLALGPKGSFDIRWADARRIPNWKVWILAGLLTMGLDVIIDPLALRGDRWFLGQIYSYPHGGVYFGVPLTNFAGWALLAWTILGVFLLAERLVLHQILPTWRSHIADAILGVGLFVGVLAFNLILTFSIGEFLLGLVGLLLAFLMALPSLIRLRSLHLRASQLLSYRELSPTRKQ